MTLSENSLSFGRDLSYEEWETVGFELFRIEEAWQWWVGDWINYGEKKYGETYKAAIEVTGKSESTLKTVASVCRKFETCRRRHVSFSHHAEVSALEPDRQDDLLDRIETEGLTKRQLREEIHGKSKQPCYFDRFQKVWDKADDIGRAAIRSFILSDNGPVKGRAKP